MASAFKKYFAWLYIFTLKALLFSCTQQSAMFQSEEFIFKGLQKITINQDGSLILNWSKVPTTDVQYLVFKRKADENFDWTQPYKTVGTTTAEFPRYNLNESYCFAVHYEAVDKVADTNKTELCADLPYVKEFTGINSAVVSGLGAVTVSFTPPPEVEKIASFGVYAGTGFDTLVATVNATETSAVVTGLAVDSTHVFGVRAIDKYGRTDTNTKTLSVKVVNNSPLTFKGIDTATLASASSVTLTWPTPAGVAKEFKVFKTTGATNTTPAIDYDVVATTVDGSLTTTTITGLGDEQAHCFAVRSVSTGLQEDQNVITKCVNVPDNGAPVFTGLKSILFSGGSANLTWDAAVGETAKYKIYYKEGTTLDYATATVIEIAAPATSYALSGLPDNRSWTFAVRAVDSRNQTDSNTVTSTAYAGDLTAPAFLGYAGGELVADSETQLTVTFNRSTDVDMSHYSIRGKVTGSSGDYVELTTIAQQGAGPISKAITGLLPATSYDIIVKAIDSSGNPSSNTAAKTRATLDLTVPTFNGITSVAGKPGDISKTRVQWTAATDAGGIKEYRVYYSTQSLTGATLIRTATYPLTVGGQTIHMSSAVTSGTTADIAGLTENTNYYFVVHAIDNADNEDTNTAQQQYTVPFYTPPAAPTGLAFSGGAGPSSNRYPFVTGNSTAGYKVKIYVDAVAVSTTSINATGAFSIQLSLPNTTGNYVVTAAHLNPSDVEGVSGAVGTYQLVVDTPVATITGAPTESSMSNATALNVTVGGTNVTQYKFAMLTQATACNATINNYSVTWTDVATPITASTGADGAKRLCVIAKNSGGFEQDITAATERNWTKNTQPPAAPTITAVSDPVTNSTSETYNGVVAVTVTSVTGASHYCAKGNTSEPAAPAAGDSCWTASTTLAAALTGSGGTTTANTIYAWSKDSAGNISTSASASTGTIDYVNICSSGTLATTCTVSTSRTLAAGGVTIGGQGSLVVASGGTITGGVGERNTITLLGNLTIQNGGVINANIDATVVNASILAGGTLNTNGLGNPGSVNSIGNGLGAGQYSGSIGSGGGHGGAGGASGVVAGGVANGSASAPTTFGSSGGGSSTHAGGAGGGAVKIVASGTANLSGLITANGMVPGNNGYSSAGAGGSIYVIAGQFDGTGTLSAVGGNGLYGGGGAGGAGGGGGRISLTGANSFKGAVSLNGGLPNTHPSFAYPGDAGTLYTSYTSICDSGSLSTTCVISNPIILGDNFSVSGSGDLVIANGGSLSTYKNLGTISIAMTGNVTVQSGGSINANISNLTAANVTIETGGTVSANGLGFQAQYSNSTSVGGTCSPTSVATGNGGGAHGGYGGHSGVAKGVGSSGMGCMTAYGTNSAPVTYGSAGGTFYYITFGVMSTSTTKLGGSGGGAIRISVASGGTLTVSGTLSADGAAGQGNVAATQSAGGGAGGSLYLTAETISGSGVISAVGGAGGAASASNSSGGGGGGRIALTSTNKFDGTISVAGGAAGGTGATAGYPGIAIFSNPDNFCTSGSMSTGTCSISGAWRFDNGASISSGGFTVANGGKIVTHPGEKFSMTMSGDITISSGGVVEANLNDLNAANLTIASGGVFSADGLGFLGAWLGANGQGPGPGLAGSTNSGYAAGGGGHGGAGGKGHGTGGSGGATYDSSTDPSQFGSSGGGNNGNSPTPSSGGDGGGLIRLVISGTLTVNGTLSANGKAGSGQCGGGGAGGGIKATANVIDGSGTISADGGAGGNSAGSGGGGGGGGIIYLSGGTFTFSGSKTANGGVVFGGTPVAGTNGPVSP